MLELLMIDMEHCHTGVAQDWYGAVMLKLLMIDMEWSCWSCSWLIWLIWSGHAGVAHDCYGALPCWSGLWLIWSMVMLELLMIVMEHCHAGVAHDWYGAWSCWSCSWLIWGGHVGVAQHDWYGAWTMPPSIISSFMQPWNSLFSVKLCNCQKQNVTY